MMMVGRLDRQLEGMVLPARKAAMLRASGESLRSRLGFAASVAERTVVGHHHLLSRGKRSKLAPTLVRCELAQWITIEIVNSLILLRLPSNRLKNEGAPNLWFHYVCSFAVVAGIKSSHFSVFGDPEANCSIHNFGDDVSGYKRECCYNN